MTIIQFGPWAPDQPSFGNSCVSATNVRPQASGWAPFAGPLAVGDALASQCVGILSFRRLTGAVETFAGTPTALYRRDGTTWVDVTPTTGVTSTPHWRFALYGDRVVATNGVDNPLRFDLGTDAVFATLTGAPKHRFPMVVRDVLVAVDVTDGSGFEVKWSGVNNSEDWTTDAGGGSQNFPDGGPVRGGTGGEFGVILQESALTRMNFVGGDLRFVFDRIEGGIGCIAPHSIVEHQGRTFYLSSEGFQLFDGAQSANISDEVITEKLFSDLSQIPLVTDAGETIVTATGDTIVIGAVNAIQGALDPRNSSVVWRIPTATANKLLIYNYRLQRWSESDADVDCLHTGQVQANPILSGMDSTNKLVRFNGTNLTPTIATGDIQLATDRGAFVRSVRGLIDADHTITVSKRTSLRDTATSKTGASNTYGKVSLRSNGRFHSFSLSSTETDWTEISGLDIEAVPSGRKI